MTGKYEPLTAVLRDAAARGQTSIEFGFDDISALVGGLPASVQVRQWWANGNQSQARAWRTAGFEVEQVYLDRGRVRFSRRDSSAARPLAARGNTLSQVAAPGSLAVVGDPVDVRVWLQWRARGAAVLDAGRRVAFATMPEAPGLYRFTLTDHVAPERRQVYLGETDNLRRRMANYRTPGSGQPTNVRLNALLLGHLAAAGKVEVSVASEATTWLSGSKLPLDMSRKASRLLAENAALVLAYATDDADIINLG
jgi:hypothetical protein